MIVGAPGTVLREVWNDIPHVGFQGNTSSIAALTSRMYSPDFPDHPNFSDQLMTGLLAHAPGNPLQPTDWAEITDSGFVGSSKRQKLAFTCSG